ncbi:MAG: hypothetical protein JWP44_738 [Mucilaginibacter sp.]|nr:hypothetical protein [Mucilaginibacter sp.]
MKFVHTLLLFLFACSKLSALGRGTDTAKSVSAESHSDSLKIALSNPDSLNLSASSHKESPYTKKEASHLNNINLSSLVKHADSVSLWAPPHLTGNLNEQLKVHKRDSLKQAIVLKRQDSLKFVTYRFRSDSIKQQIKGMSLDSLKRQLALPANEWLKGQIYTEIASRYLISDTINNKITRFNFQNKVLNNTMMALHQYSLFNDTTGLRICFETLTKVYYAQKKYSQAKWFILQANTLARAKNDVPNIISSLLTLAAIKSDIKDYKLAMSDLNEALQLSTLNHNTETELNVLKSLAMLYSRLKDYPKEALILKKRDSIEESIRKEEAGRLMAINLQAQAQKKKLDSLQSKKKLYTLNMQRPSKNNSSKKMASL